MPLRPTIADWEEAEGCEGAAGSPRRPWRRHSGAECGVPPGSRRSGLPARPLSMVPCLDAACPIKTFEALSALGTLQRTGRHEA